MTAEDWARLSAWHNAWLDADPAERFRLRQDLASAAPDLVAEADHLTAMSEALPAFLETPAFLLAAREAASDEVSLAPGTSVGPYRIVSLIARGGMGIVYRAADVRLDREVALKMLAPMGLPDHRRVDRFVREARLTGALDHPNVVKVYDVGVHDGQPYMVTELLEGETLRSVLTRGPLSERDVRRIGTDIASGLLASGAAGLVHRDLKPENVFVTRGGVTKVLDFGIAKLAPERARRRDATSTLTGFLIGTAGYLAPEQILGDDADARTDLFALGAILFEMITGQRAFARENTVDTLHAILHEPPPDLIGRADISPALAAIVARLLEKSPADRFQTAADLAWALREHSTGQAPRARSTEVETHAAPRPLTWTRWRWIAVPVAMALVASVAWWIGRHAQANGAGAVARFTWALPDGSGLWSAPAVSPDGRRIAWAGVTEAGGALLFVRELSAEHASRLAGTEGARHPFWSPDGEWLGYFARGTLRKVRAGGGPSVDLAAAPDAKGGAWSRTGTIVFQPTYRDAPLLRVSDRGGPVEPATALDETQEDKSHRWPAFLPDGSHFLYFVLSTRDDRRGVFIRSLDEPAGVAGQRLFLSDSGAVYAPGPNGSPGAILTVGNGRVEVRPFDATRRVISGDAREVGVGARAASPHHPALVSASADVLAFGSTGIPWGFHFARVDRDGSHLVIGAEQELGGFPRLSPDGRFLARSRVDPLRSNPDIWLEDLQRGTELRLTTSGDHDVMPVWSPDGREIVYRSGTLDRPTIAFTAADGSGPRRTMSCPVLPCEASDWSPDGRYLVVTVNGRDVWTVPVGPSGKPEPLLAESFVERDARVSPDGRWLAYVSDETGRPEISVRSLIGAPRRIVVSRGGGDQPVWRRDGAELLFAGPEGRLIGVPVRAGPAESLLFGTPVRLEVPPLGERHWGTIYDVSPDGRRIYFPHSGDERLPREVGIVMGWRALVR